MSQVLPSTDVDQGASVSPQLPSCDTHVPTTAGKFIPPPPLFARGFGSYNGRQRRKHHYNDNVGKVVDLRAYAACILPNRSHGPSAQSSPLSTPCGSPLLCSSTGKGDPPTKILEFLFLGSVRDAQNADFLRRNHIRAIINISREEYWSVDNSIMVMHFKVDDSGDFDITRHFYRTRQIIDVARDQYFTAKATGSTVTPRILVHCQQGRSRSATIVLAYLIYCNGWSVAEALQYVTRRRPCVEPNLGFLVALRNFQESMDPDDRTRRYSQLGLVLKNVSTSTSRSTVKKFFEKRIGLVRDVAMHTKTGNDDQRGGAMMMERSSENIPNEPPLPKQCTLTLVSFACMESVLLARQYIASHPEELQGLGPVLGKEVRMVIHSKIKPVKASKRNTA